MNKPEIINRVANSTLITIDLEDYYPNGTRVVFDIKDWLYESLVLREKEFRAFVEAHDWNSYKDKYIALCCTSQAIIPAWAYMLVRLRLSEIAKQVIVGDLEALETNIYHKIIDNLDGQCLHAQSLGFIHPKTEKNHIYQCDMPKNLRNLIDSFTKKAIEK